MGIDEAGRGCWAGPLVAAAVILKEPLPGLADSKKLSKKQREHLYDLICTQAHAYGVGWASPAEVDEFGLTAATSLAMNRAMQMLPADHTEIIIDGNSNYLPDQPRVKTIVKADALIPEVSAASILAKVSRDRYMTEIASQYPLYQFEKHVGYGTALHLSLLKMHGVCDLHRRSYKPVKQFLIVKK